MKRRLVMAMLCATMVFAGCSGSESETEKTENSSTETDIQEPVDEKKEDEDVSAESGNVSTTENTYGVYIGAESVTEMEMGVNENGEQEVLCRIKLPTNCFLSSLNMNENGEEETMLETNGNLLSDILELGHYQKSGKIPSTIMMTIQGKADCSYTLSIFDSEEYSVAWEKDFTPDGIDIGAGSDHEAYVCYDATEQFDLVFAYQISEDWTLLVRNSGDVKDQMSLEEFGQEMYQLITPLQ